MTVDVETKMVLEQMAAAGGQPLHEMWPEEARVLGAKCAELAGRGPEMARVAGHSIARPNGDAAVRVLLPFETARSVIV